MWIAGVCNDCLQILRSRPPKPIAESEYIHGDEHPNVQGPRGLAGWNGFGRQHLRVQRVAPSRRAVRSMCADAPCRSLSSQQRRRGSRVSYGAARLSPAHTDCTGILRGTRDTSRAVSQAVSENRTGARGRREEADSNRPAASWALTRVETNQGSKRRFETPVRRGTPWGSALQGASPRASELPSVRAPEPTEPPSFRFVSRALLTPTTAMAARQRANLVLGVSLAVDARAWPPGHVVCRLVSHETPTSRVARRYRCSCRRAGTSAGAGLHSACSGSGDRTRRGT